MGYYTYILISKNGKKTYTGHTADLQKRLHEHNAGDVKSSKKHRPYEILRMEAFETLKEAKKRELYYKNFRGRQKIKQIIEEREQVRAAHFIK